jgi:hypothetical protein
VFYVCLSNPTIRFAFEENEYVGVGPDKKKLPVKAILLASIYRIQRR